MEEKVMLEECPICRGAGVIMHEGGWSVQVECCDCSAHTLYMEYNNEEILNAWFCGFFPYDSPRYAMAVLCENGKSGADSCVAPFVEIAEKITKIQ